jgi:hypothetical protein
MHRTKSFDKANETTYTNGRNFLRIINTDRPKSNFTFFVLRHFGNCISLHPFFQKFYITGDSSDFILFRRKTYALSFLHNAVRLNLANILVTIINKNKLSKLSLQLQLLKHGGQFF